MNEVNESIAAHSMQRPLDDYLDDEAEFYQSVFSLKAQLGKYHLKFLSELFQKTSRKEPLEIFSTPGFEAIYFTIYEGDSLSVGCYTADMEFQVLSNDVMSAWNTVNQYLFTKQQNFEKHVEDITIAGGWIKDENILAFYIKILKTSIRDE